MERGSRDDDRQLAAGHHGRPPCSILGADAPSAPHRARKIARRAYGTKGRRLIASSRAGLRRFRRIGHNNQAASPATRATTRRLAARSMSRLTTATARGPQTS